MSDLAYHARFAVPALALMGFLGLTGAEPMSAQGTRMLRSPTVSPTHIAFVNANDIWIVGRDGGRARRLTWHPGADIALGWTPDGASVLFQSGREGHPTASVNFWTVPVQGGLPTSLPIPRANSGEISGDGQYVAYQEIGFWDPEWRNYRGGQAE